jgi:modification methylase
MATAPVLSHALEDFVPASLRNLGDAQTALPRIARDPALTAEIEAQLANIPTSHDLYEGDARRQVGDIEAGSVHLVLTSPPYWTLKEYRRSDGQLGYVEDYGAFNHELEKIWRHCWKALAPGGRLVIVVGDVCLSRRQNDGRHTVVPLHASITESCRKLGFDNLAPIFWYKIANASYEVENG